MSKWAFRVCLVTAAAVGSLLVSVPASAAAVATVTAVSPGVGQAGTQVTVTGTGFAGVSSVTFGAAAAGSVSVVSATMLVATAPLHGAGVVDVRVTTAAGVSPRSTADTFTYSTFTASPAPAPADAYYDPDTRIRGIACPAAGWCVASGSYWLGYGRAGVMVETLSNGVWTSARAPLPADARVGSSASLSAPVCPAVGSCIIPGAYDAGPNNRVAMVQTLAGGVWTATRLPLPAGVRWTSSPGSEVDQAACPAVGWCVAAGDYTDASGGNHGLIETLSGGVWTAHSVDPANVSVVPQFRPIAVSCAAVGSCVVVDAFLPFSTASYQIVRALLVTLADGKWTMAQPPAPAGVQGTPVMHAVSCWSAGSCVAIGTAYNDSDGGPAMALTLSAGRWTPSVIALPAGVPDTMTAVLASISCVAGGACTAVGDYSSPGVGDFHAMIASRSADGVWTSTAPPLASPSAFGNVKCWSAGACTAVAAQGCGQASCPVSATLTGGTWHYRAMPVPPRTAAANQDAGVGGLACAPRVRWCAAEGVYYPKPGYFEAFLETGGH